MALLDSNIEPSNSLNQITNDKDMIKRTNNIKSMQEVINVNTVANSIGESLANVKDTRAELELYKKNLQDTGKYQIQEEKLIYTLKGYSSISNFIAVPIKKIIYTNGRDTNIVYKLKGIYLEDLSISLPELEVTLKEYNAFNFIIGSEWDKYCIVECGYYNNSRLREVAQIIGKHSMNTTYIYTHTGFIEVTDGKKVYLYEGGSVGDIEGIEADLSQDGLQDYCFTSKVYDKKEAVRTSYSMLELTNTEATIPLLATLYLAPLQTMLESVEIYTDYVLFLAGKTGSRKSSIAAVVLNHFGPNFNKDNLPASFKDTINNLEKKAYTLKDGLIVIDDFNPEIVGNRKLVVLEQVFGIFGDHQGRGRMKTDGKSLSTAYKARSMAIVTGEMVPTNLPESRLARSFIINIEKESVNLELLTILQENKEMLSFAMMEYIKWIIDNESRIKEYAKTSMYELRKIQDDKIHGRTNDSLNVMKIGFNLFLEFLKDNEIIDQNKQNELKKLAEQTLDVAAKQQTDEIIKSNPITMFYNAIEELINTDKICLLDYATGEPITKYSRGKIVGYLDREEGYYYFYEKIIYKEICNFYSYLEGGFPLEQGALLKYLNSEQLLYRNDPTRYHIKRTDPIKHDKVKVIAVKVKEDIDN